MRSRRRRRRGCRREPDHLLALSGQSVPAVRELAGRYAGWLGEHPEASLADVCFTAGRAVATSSSGRPSWWLGRAGRPCWRRCRGTRRRPGCTGGAAVPAQGGLVVHRPGEPVPGMAHELYAASRPSAGVGRVRPAADAALGGRRFRTCSSATDGLLEQTAYAQGALFALQMALVALWRGWGVEPDVVLGHSVGQYAAACMAGVFTLEEGLRLLVERGRLLGALPAGGAMAAVFAPAARVAEAVRAHADLSIAADNGTHVVVSGPASAVASLTSDLESAGLRCQRLATSHAFHSALVEPALEEFEALATGVESAADAADAGVQPDGSAAGGRSVAGRVLLAAARPGAGAVRPQCGDAGGTGLRSAPGGGSAAGAVQPGAGLLACRDVDPRPGGQPASGSGRRRRCWRRWRSCTPAALRRTSRPSTPPGRGGGWRCRPTRSNANATGSRVRPSSPCSRAGRPTRCWGSGRSRPPARWSTATPSVAGSNRGWPTTACSTRWWRPGIYLGLALGASVLPGRLAAVHFERWCWGRRRTPADTRSWCSGPSGAEGRSFQFFSKSLSAEARWTQHARGQLMPGSAGQDAVAEGWESLSGRLRAESVAAFYDGDRGGDRLRCRLPGAGDALERGRRGVGRGPHSRGVVDAWRGLPPGGARRLPAGGGRGGWRPEG